MPSRTCKTDVSETEIREFMELLQPNIEPMVLRSGAIVPPPDNSTVRQVLSKITHTDRLSLFTATNEVDHLDGSCWAGRCCRGAPRLGNLYLRRVLYHWMKGPLRVEDELVSVGRRRDGTTCNCALPYHNIVRPRNGKTLDDLHAAVPPCTRRYLRSLGDTFDIDLWSALLNLDTPYIDALMRCHDPPLPLDAQTAVFDAEHSHAHRVCVSTGLHRAAFVGSTFGAIAIRLGFTVREIAERTSFFDLVMFAIRKGVDGVLLHTPHEDTNCGPRDRPWIHAGTLSQAILLAQQHAAQVCESILSVRAPV